MRSQRLFSWLLAGSLGLGASAAPVNSSRPTVTLSSGVVVGTTVAVSSARAAVKEFLGIPYASSPPQRFSPPTAAPSWTAPLDASAVRDTCVQQFDYPEIERNFSLTVFNNPGGSPPVESEDCLYINVYTPACDAPANGWTVMVWIYGGNLQFGSASNDIYNGSSFAANQNVVLVNFNYRTNVFGFPNSPEIPTGQQNVGLLDQRFALQWVQDNIAAFGGDPAKVLIFGESAGGYSVKQLMVLPPDPLPFRAAIMESEATTTSSSGLQSWDSLVSSLNCTAAASQLACVRAAPATTIKSIIEQAALPFPPVLDNVTAMSNSGPAFAAGTAARVPFMIGTNADEGRPFAYEELLTASNISVDAYLESLLPGQTALIDALEALYPTALYDSVYLALSALETDVAFTCPTSLLAEIAAAGGYDVWRYYFDASFPNTQLWPDAGVYHSSEIPEVFGTYPTAGATKQQVKLSQYMQRAWANFAKDPAAGPGWPQIGSNGGVELAELGGNGSYGERTVPLLTTDTPCAVIDPILALTGV